MAKKKTKSEKKVEVVMKEYGKGELKSGGSGKKVTNLNQAIAIALSEAGLSKKKSKKKTQKKTLNRSTKTSIKKRNK